MENLNSETILHFVNHEYKTFLTKLDLFDSIDSTNTYLLKQAKNIMKSGGWACFTEHQTAGRGRQGKVWLSPKKQNLYFSLLWQFQKNNLFIPCLSLVIGIAIAELLKQFVLKISVQVKWPNDIYIGGKKIAGILLESNKSNQVVIGIGLNILATDKNILPDSTSLIEAMEMNINSEGLSTISTFVSRNKVAGLLLNKILETIIAFEEIGAEPFLQKWHEYDFLLNKTINVFRNNATMTGVSRGINELGQLIFEHEDKRIELLNSGEVSIRPHVHTSPLIQP